MLIGLLLVAAPFYRILFFSDRALFYRDLARDILPAKLLWAESVASGYGIPHWNHHAFSGVPFWAINVEGPLHPLNLLFLLSSPEEAPRTLSLFLWLHYLVFFLGWRFLFRRLNCRPLLASLGAAMVTISGWSLSLHSLAHLLGSVAVAPWFLGLLVTWLRKRKWLTLVLLSGCIAWPIYAGDPQVALLLAALAAGAILLSHRPLRSRLSDVALLASLSFLASASQLLPTWDLLRRSTRQSIDLSETLLFSLHPLRLLETVFPVFFGNHFDDHQFWGSSLVNFPYPTPFIFSVHLGPAVLLGAILWFQRAGRWRWPALAMTTLFLLAALGSHGPVPLYEWMARWAPLFGKFRYPERLIVWPLLAVSLAGVCGWRGWRHDRAPLWGGLLAGIALTAAGFAVWLVPETLQRGHAAQESLLRGLTVWLASAVLVALLKKERPLVLALLAALWFGDAVLTGTRLVWDQSKHVASHSRYPLIQDLKAAMAAERELISRGGAHRISTNSMTNYLFPSGRIPHSSLSTFAAYQNLVPNVGAGAGLYDVAGYFSIVPRQRFLFDSLFFQGNDLERRLSVYNNLMAAAWVPERNQIQQTILRRNPAAQPSVHAPRVVHRADGLEKTVAAILDPKFSSTHDAVIAAAAKKVDETTVRQEDHGRVDQLVRTGREIRFRWRPSLAEKKRALEPKTWIVINESHDPHWKASADGVPVPIHLANGWAMAVEIPGRESEILLRYENPWIPRGITLTVFWLFALSWLAVSTALGRPARRGL